MKKKIVKLIVLLIITMVNTILLNGFVYASDISTAYNEELNRIEQKYADGYEAPTEYSLYDVDGNEIEELILHYGGSMGSICRGYENGDIIYYDGGMGCNVTYYSYKNKLYSINLDIAAGDEYYVTHNFWLSEICITGKTLYENTIWQGLVTQSMEDLNNPYYDSNKTLSSQSAELANVIHNGTELQFYPINNRSPILSLKNNAVKVILNNQELQFDQPPVIDAVGRVLVPIRQIAESMGDNVMWNQPLQTAFVHHKERALIIPLNLNYLYIATSDKPSQWQRYDLDVPSQVANGRTLTPLRAFCEGLGADVKWDGNTKTVYITYNNDYEYDVLPEQQIDGINMAYGLIRNNPNLSFDKYSNEIIDYFDNSNHVLNNAAMAWGDSLLSGIVQLLSGEDATESAVKERLAYIVSMLAEMDTKNGNYEFVKNIMFNKSGMEALQKFVSLPEENVKITSIKDLENLSETVPELENLSNAIDATGLAVDILAFSAEESIYLLADYTQNIAYLDNIEKYLRGTATGYDIIYNSIDELKKEYSQKWLHTVREIRKDGTDKVISAMLDKGTAGVFSIVNFAKDLTNKITGLSTSAEGLREFYAVCILNVAFDEAYSKMANRVFERPFYADDMIVMFNIQKATKISTYESMNKIANAVEEISYDNQIAELNNKSYILW